jgi:DNA-binding NarL/FixJ family response regulator
MNPFELVNVLVIHRDPVVAAGIESVLCAHSDLCVRPSSASSRERPASDPSEGRDTVVVADYQSGIDFLIARKASGGRREAGTTRVLVISLSDREGEVRCALNEGAHGYVLQSCTLEELVDGVRMLGRGGRYLSVAASQRIVESLGREALTHREAQVLELLASGCCNKTIARDLGIALGTVKAHVKGVLEKLDASTRTQAVVVAGQRGLVNKHRPMFERNNHVRH